MFQLGQRILKQVVKYNSSFKQLAYSQRIVYSFSNKVVINKDATSSKLANKLTLSMIEDPSYKDQLLKMIEDDPNSLNKVLKKLEQLASQNDGKMVEVFEQKYFRHYVYLVSQYFGIYKKSLGENLGQNIKLINRIAKIYTNLGHFTFQKQELITKKVVNCAIESAYQLDLSQIHQVLFVLATFKIRKLHYEDSLFKRTSELILKEKDTIDLDFLVEVHSSLSTIASVRSQQDKNAILVLMDMLNNLMYEKREQLSFGNVVKICQSLNRSDSYINKIFLAELVTILQHHLIKNKLDNQRIKENYHLISQHYIAFSSISYMENTITDGAFYIYAFDEYYQLLSVVFNNWIDSFSPKQLGEIASHFQRIGYYDSKLMMAIANQIMKFDFYGFEVIISHFKTTLSFSSLKQQFQNVFYFQKLIKQDDESSNLKKQIKDIRINIQSLQNENQHVEPSSRQEFRQVKSNEVIELEKKERILSSKLERINKKISQNFNNLNSLIKIIHSLGHSNIRDDASINQQEVDRFLNNFYQVIELFSLKFQQEKTTGVHFDPQNITRSIWALCVLDTPANIAVPLNRLINKFLFNEENSFYQLNKADLSILYYAYLYLAKHPGVFPSQLVQIIHSLYSQQILKSKKNISQLCYDVKRQIDKLQIPNNLEVNVDNILVDIIIPEQFLGKQVIIDVNGYQHYFRNEDKIKGNSILKKKIIEQYYNNIYVIVPQFEWELIDKDSKLQYVQDLFLAIQQRIKSGENKN